MSGDHERGRSGTGSLEDVRNVDLPEKSTARLLFEQLYRRWKTLGAIVVLLVTTYMLFYMDDAVSTDVLVFAFLTVLLGGYFLVTLRNDLKLE